MPGVLVVALWLATGLLATWLIGSADLAAWTRRGGRK